MNGDDKIAAAIVEVKQLRERLTKLDEKIETRNEQIHSMIYVSDPDPEGGDQDGNASTGTTLIENVVKKKMEQVHEEVCEAIETLEAKLESIVENVESLKKAIALNKRKLEEDNNSNGKDKRVKKND